MKIISSYEIISLPPLLKTPCNMTIFIISLIITPPIPTYVGLLLELKNPKVSGTSYLILEYGLHTAACARVSAQGMATSPCHSERDSAFVSSWGSGISSKMRAVTHWAALEEGAHLAVEKPETV